MAAATVTHSFVSAKSDGADSSLIQPSNWNATHALTGEVQIANGGTAATTAAGARTNLGLGTMATQDASSVAIAGGTVGGVTISTSTLTLPQINDTSSDHQYVFAVSELAADRTVTLPLLTGSDTFVFADHQQTLTNKTLTSPVMTTPTLGDASATSLTATTLDATNLEVTNLKAKDGTAAGSIADATGVVTLASSVLTTADINGGTIDGTVIGGGVGGAAAGTFTTLTSTGNATLGDDEATDTHAIKGATTILSNSASPALTVTNTGSGNSFVVEDSASPDTSSFVIDGSGRVIVGGLATVATVSGNAKLQVQNNGLAISAQTYSADTVGALIDFTKSRNATIGSGTVVQSGDDIAQFRFCAYDGAAYIRAASISVAVDGTPGTNDMPGRLAFSTTADGASNPTERMLIASNGAISKYQGSPATQDTAATLTIAQILTGIIQSNPGSNITLTLPTGTDADTGTSYGTDNAVDWSLINTNGTYTVTVAAGTAHTVVGNMTVAISSTGVFRTRRTATNTFVTYRVG